MKIELLNIKLEFQTPLLGSSSGNKALHEEHIASKAPTTAAAAEELSCLDVADEIHKAMTVFPKDENGLFIWDYQVKGFLKESIAVLIELGDIKDLSKWSHKKAVDSLIFIQPRRIYLKDSTGKPILKATETLQRPLRAETMKGERVALASSEMLPEGTQCQFTLKLLSGDNKKTKLAVVTLDNIQAALDYGAMKGFGQWRSGGYGMFNWQSLEAAA